MGVISHYKDTPEYLICGMIPTLCGKENSEKTKDLQMMRRNTERNGNVH